MAKKSKKTMEQKKNERLANLAKAHVANRANKGKQTLLARVREMLRERCKNSDGKTVTRFDLAADAFIQAMTNGSFHHLKEFIEREEGKVPVRHAGADGETLKMYVGMPVEDEKEAP